MNDETKRDQFDDTYAEHAGRVYRFAIRLAGNREEAEDLAVEAFAEAYRQWDGYRGESGRGTWLCAIVLNRWRMHRRKRRVPVDPLRAAEDVASTFQFEDLELAQAISSLPVRLREAFLLVKGEGFTHAEAAKALRVPVGTMSFRVHAAVRRLRAELGPDAKPAVASIGVTCDQDV